MLHLFHSRVVQIFVHKTVFSCFRNVLRGPNYKHLASSILWHVSIVLWTKLLAILLTDYFVILLFCLHDSETCILRILFMHSNNTINNREFNSLILVWNFMKYSIPCFLRFLYACVFERGIREFFFLYLHKWRKIFESLWGIL